MSKGLAIKFAEKQNPTKLKRIISATIGDGILHIMKYGVVSKEPAFDESLCGEINSYQSWKGFRYINDQKETETMTMCKECQKRIEIFHEGE